MKTFLFIANKFPNSEDPNGLVFFQQLIWEIADMGYRCIVICPLAINLYFKYRKVDYHVIEKTENGNNVDVFFPKFFGLGQSHKIFGKSPIRITTYLFTKSVINTIKKNNLYFDFVYGHFTAPAGVVSARIGKKYNVPSYFAHGESTSYSIDQFGSLNLKKELKNISGVVAVSTRNMELVLNNDIVESDKIKVFPNGYREERFYQINKEEARNHFGWGKDLFIVGFCGSFDNRKGVLRLEKSIDMINDNNIKFACAGKGSLIPTSNKCILKKSLHNNELIYFYNAIDVFCLPTRNEGCCNAIIEAMACGCPIISSDKSFNYDILDSKNSILIDCDNVDEIKGAILALYKCDEKIKSMSNYSLKKAKALTLHQRAANIINFMEQMGEKYEKL